MLPRNAEHEGLFRKISLLTFFLLAGILVLDCCRVANAASPVNNSPISEFFVGELPHQMYVQHWKADSSTKKGPLIMIHGGAHSGVAWTTTPDGRPGWAPIFAARGWDVYVVDWPGVGRSGFRPENLLDSPNETIDALALLLKRTGPAVLLGHSIGGAMAFKLTERYPDSVLAMVGLAPASAETVSNLVTAAPTTTAVTVPPDAVKQRFTNSAKFPQDAFDNYFLSLVPFPAPIRNATSGLTNELKIDRTKTQLWKRIPTLVLSGEEDKTVPLSRLEETASAMNVPIVMLGRDWGMPGHGHLFVVEQESEAIADRVEDWITRSLKK